MSASRTLAAIAVVLALAACTTARDTMPQRSATEQLLISSAADRAVERLPISIPKGAMVFVDAGNFEGYDGKYVVGAVRDRVVRLGGRLAADRGTADTVVEVRAGALSIDEKRTLFGIPSFDIPVPLAGSGLKTPEVALFKKHNWIGVAKIAATGYDAKGDKFAASWGPEIARAHKTYWTVMLFVSWTTDDLLPEEKRGVGGVFD